MAVLLAALWVLYRMAPDAASTAGAAGVPRSALRSIGAAMLFLPRVLLWSPSLAVAGLWAVAGGEAGAGRGALSLSGLVPSSLPAPPAPLFARHPAGPFLPVKSSRSTLPTARPSLTTTNSALQAPPAPRCARWTMHSGRRGGPTWSPRTPT